MTTSTERQEPRATDTYWVTLAISAQDLAQEMCCTVENIESGDYFGAIRAHADIVNSERVEE